MTPEERDKLWPILFWGPKIQQRRNDGKMLDPMGVLAELFIAAVTSHVPNVQPKDCVVKTIPRADREVLAKALANGTMFMSYMGWADCRICGAELGTRDMTGWGFLWPEKAEHYILEHDVWTPGCSRLLAAIRST